ncbi:MAG TPA: preprotein translocase subunit SecG [Balneola sp.]|jgi:preprotein translocase subunit SecG|nr:preprotein translocase subunit SecG [Bacteroidota bacterium]MAC06658.1 preprotein translocase subunit SecG [Balneola sp.]MAO77731.1 preprotein translocase subunit SecG [Balneola sp.]MBF63872.1 preprotein translocase subunit SecG [Balneola sp.]HAH52385.1 preprotein translocase subunit SecG [Balneola sp.]|tara:strand:- start:16583 stop:16978 length:396 start_codon:yes stop_codon:yes gene_type:complete
MLYNILVAVITIICALLILVVLLQNGQGSGLSGISGGGGGGALGGNSGLGARRTADLLSKATGVFGAAFLVLCILANFAIDRTGQGPTRSILQDGGAPVQDLNAPSQTQSAVPIQSNDNGGSDDSGEEGDN